MCHSFKFKRPIVATLLVSLSVALPLDRLTPNIFPTSVQAQTTRNNSEATGEWQEFTSSVGRFSVLMPGTPTEKVEPQNTQAGTGETRQYWLETNEGNVAYGIAYTDFPSIREQLSTSQISELLDSGREGLLGSDKNSKLVSERNITLNGYMGREIEVEAEKGFIKFRAYWVDRRLYGVMVAARSKADFPQGGDRFFDSFKLVAANAPRS